MLLEEVAMRAQAEARCCAGPNSRLLVLLLGAAVPADQVFG